MASMASMARRGGRRRGGSEIPSHALGGGGFLNPVSTWATAFCLPRPLGKTLFQGHLCLTISTFDSRFFFVSSLVENFPKSLIFPRHLFFHAKVRFCTVLTHFLFCCTELFLTPDPRIFFSLFFCSYQFDLIVPYFLKIIPPILSGADQAAARRFSKCYVVAGCLIFPCTFCMYGCVYDRNTNKYVGLCL